MMNSLLIQTLTQKLPQRILAKFGFGKDLAAAALRKQSTKLSCVNELILFKFEACLLGALIGDCIGKKFEGIWGPNLAEMLDEFRALREKLEQLEQQQCHMSAEESFVTSFESYLSESNKRPYTDDTALTRALCDSFISCAGEFVISDVASEFEATYSSDPNRGYSSGSIILFKKLNKLKQANELNGKCLEPAMELFNGEGSYGNGGGMRCTAIALFCYTKSLDEMRIVCELATRMTHAHKWAILGALQQCYALRLALESTKSWRTYDFDAFYHSITTFVYDLERNFDSLDQINAQHLDSCSKSTRDSFMLYLEQKNELSRNKNKKSHHRHHHHNHHAAHTQSAAQQDQKQHNNNLQTHTYSKLLRKLKRVIRRCRAGSILNTVKLYKHISSYGVSALETIPMALFAFMVASDTRCRNELSAKLNSADPFAEFTPIERVLFYAISLGGETNKVASMAAALAGAFYSSKDLPRYLAEMCEGASDVSAYSQRLFDFTAAAAAATASNVNPNDAKQQQQYYEPVKITTPITSIDTNATTNNRIDLTLASLKKRRYMCVKI